jgi:hypothetical protein
MFQLTIVECHHNVNVQMCVKEAGIKSQYFIFCIKVIFYFLTWKGKRRKIGDEEMKWLKEVLTFFFCP